MKIQKTHTTTTFQLSHHLHTQLKMMCMLTHKSMGEFIRIAVLEKIKQLNEQKSMSKDAVERKLDVMIYLLENLPRRICDEMAIRAEIKSQQERERALEEKEALLLVREASAKYKMDNHNG